ncbi:DUF3515 domain-containing protein [Spirillospora sp. NPDC052242]
MVKRRGAPATVLALVAALAVACGDGAVQVAPPEPDAAARRLCEGLRLPEKLHGQDRRDTAPETALTAAWGSPPIGLRCGVPRPATLRPESQLVTINGINWYPTPSDPPVTYTAVARQAYVEVTVPPEYHPAGDVLIELSPAIKATIPEKPEGQI